jgi:hypothetical protein
VNLLYLDAKIINLPDHQAQKLFLNSRIHHEGYPSHGWTDFIQDRHGEPYNDGYDEDNNSIEHSLRFSPDEVEALLKMLWINV